MLSLLRSLISLAEDENDRTDILHYRELLAAADPSVDNKIALAKEYALQGKAEEAWGVVDKSKEEVAKDPLDWKDLISQVDDPDYSKQDQGRGRKRRSRRRPTRLPGATPLRSSSSRRTTWRARKATLWQIVAEPLPTPAAGATTGRAGHAAPAILRAPSLPASAGRS